MNPAYAFLPDLAEATEIPRDGTLSRTIYSDDAIKVVLFGFDAGQELSEHTAARPALIQILRGQARLSLGSDTHQVGPGAWVRMPANLRHSLRAETPLVMLLTLLPAAEADR